MADTYTHFALAYTAETHLNDTPTAIAHYTTVTTDGTVAGLREQAFGNLGRLHGLSGDTEAAIQTTRKGLEEFPLSAVLHNNIAVAYAAQGDQKRAAAHQAEAARITQLQQPAPPQ